MVLHNKFPVGFVPVFAPPKVSLYGSNHVMYPCWAVEIAVSSRLVGYTDSPIVHILEGVGADVCF